MYRNKGMQGFTLVEIIAVLVILGVLAAVAVPKYYDLQKDAESKAAEAAAAEAQARVNLQFGKQVLAGDSCGEAKKNAVDALNAVTSPNLGNGWHIAIDTVKNDSTATETNISSLKKGATEYVNGGKATATYPGVKFVKIYLPDCSAVTKSGGDK